MKKSMSLILAAAAAGALCVAPAAFAEDAANPPITSAAGYNDETGVDWTLVLDNVNGKVYLHQLSVDPEDGDMWNLTSYSGQVTDYADQDDGSTDFLFTDDENGNEYTINLAPSKDSPDFGGVVSLLDSSCSVAVVDPKVADIATGLAFFVGIDSAGNDVAVGYNNDLSMFYYCGYMAEDPGTPIETQFSDVTAEQTEDSITFTLTGNDGSTQDVLFEYADPSWLAANITIGDDEPFKAAYVDLETFPDYAAAVAAETEAE